MYLNIWVALEMLTMFQEDYLLLCLKGWMTSWFDFEKMGKWNQAIREGNQTLKDYVTFNSKTFERL